ncbi:hypothetical protein NL108_017328 [Boleophthalmus pectinirostris]|nr:hypothetical protein NL108_017328 [Boleophthalmus pectinirostris]
MSALCTLIFYYYCLFSVLFYFLKMHYVTFSSRGLCYQLVSMNSIAWNFPHYGIKPIQLAFIPLHVFFVFFYGLKITTQKNKSTTCGEVGTALLILISPVFSETLAHSFTVFYMVWSYASARVPVPRNDLYLPAVLLGVYCKDV